MAQSDVISIHANLTAETERMINEKSLSAVKPGAIIINTARGKIVDLDVLYEAMKDNRVAAAGLDVLPLEPSAYVQGGNPLDQPLIRAFCDKEEWVQNRLLLTPHTAYLTEESRCDMRSFPIDIVAAYLKEGRLLNCINEQWLEKA